MTQLTSVTFKESITYFIENPSHVFQYFSLWCLILFFFTPIVHPYVNVLLLFCIIVPLGSWFTQVCPGYIKLNDHQKYNKTFLLDWLFHKLPFIILIIYYYKNNLHGTLTNVSGTLIFIIIYLIIYDAYKVYDICLDRRTVMLFILMTLLVLSFIITL